MLLSQIKSDLTNAQKSRDQEKIDTLRFLLGALRNFRIEKYPQGDDNSLTNEDVLGVIQKQVKTHKESIEMFKQGGRSDLVEKEDAQLVILQGYMPAQMSEEEIMVKVKELRVQNPDLDFGGMMKICMAELRGKADGSQVSKILLEVIQS